MTTKRAVVFLAALAMLPSAPVRAEIVVTRDGRVYDGKVSRAGQKVLIETPAGRVEVDESDIIQMADISTQPAATTAPASPEALTTAASAQLRLQDIDSPEPFVFMAMRNLSATPPGHASVDLHRQLDKWRIEAHDRRRRAGNEWIGPQDFMRRRAAFETFQADADALLKKAKSAKTDLEKRRFEQEAMQKLRQAAGAWPDDLIRSFLLGVAYLQSQDARQARIFFTHCRTQAPRVPAFRQGLGMTLLDLDRPLEALEELTALLRLRPDSAQALELVRVAMRRVPGADTKSPAYLEAASLADQYQPPSGSSSTASQPTRWLMPGKDWQGKDKLLPVPPCDRLIFRQAVAVAVSQNTLLVDAAAVETAEEVFVRAEDGTLMPARLKRVTSSSTTKVPLPPLACLSVSGFQLEPLAVDKAATFEKDTAVTVTTIDFLEQMNKATRSAPGKVESDGGEAAVSVRLCAGESAGPLATSDGRLVGVLAGKTDVTADDGGPDRLIGLAELAPLLDRARSTSSYGYGGYGAAKRKPADPVSLKGSFFVVHAVAYERLEK